jgi:hypothetical protein
VTVTDEDGASGSVTVGIHVVDRVEVIAFDHRIVIVQNLDNGGAHRRPG